MAFAIDISEVGPAEYPLLEVLRDAVFGEFGHISHATVTAQLTGQDELHVLVAHLEGNPVGFSAGYRRTPHCYYINYLAILRDYRRQGIGDQFMARQEMFARSRGFERIQFNTLNRFRGMMLLGLSRSYRPVGLEQHAGTDNDLVIRFGRTLTANHDVDSRLIAALERGEEIAGLVRQTDGSLKTVLASEKR